MFICTEILTLDFDFMTLETSAISSKTSGLALRRVIYTHFVAKLHDLETIGNDSLLT